MINDFFSNLRQRQMMQQRFAPNNPAVQGMPVDQGMGMGQNPMPFQMPNGMGMPQQPSYQPSNIGVGLGMVGNQIMGNSAPSGPVIDRSQATPANNNPTFVPEMPGKVRKY